MAITKPAPRGPWTRPSDAIFAVASLAGMAADTDLRTLGASFPKHAPQRVLLIGGASALAAVLQPENGSSTITITVPINQVIELHHPIKTLIKSGSGAVGVVCEWWASGSDWA